MELIGAQRISDDVIVATSRHTLDAPQGPLAGVHEAMSTSVLVRRRQPGGSRPPTTRSSVRCDPAQRAGAPPAPSRRPGWSPRRSRSAGC